ncbi:magnesium/cobalt transporter CorA [Cohnella silvisoli]|uniref:Magnesium transport protein CorA n=1 Tax=Cohnella silvisoli TaxID=2873699 RepID=A0ABV1L151_9BACL|nr:magnesium/cobalt transporter CorA [Cohnella silvisoli]MCD9025547.1 magnesium/cobalt transporter CorA [Cohnella silvisoli]
MIRIVAMTRDGDMQTDLSLSDMKDEKFAWYWADFDQPSPEETKFLSDHFSFHKLAIEDCVHHIPRPKADFYGDYKFLVVHSLKGEYLLPEEVDIFLSEKYIVTFHLDHNETVKKAMDKLIQKHHVATSPIFTAYLVIDEMVDDFFPPLLKIEERLDEVENMSVKHASGHIFDAVYDIRADLLKIRSVVHPMRDLLYRMVNSERLGLNEENKLHFMDVYDHLLKLSEKLADDRDTTADIVENVNSVLNHRTNQITLKTNDIVLLLTIISVIFIPLTFIVGVYGMNFDNIPELHWKYGYFIAWGVMIAIAVTLFVIFKKKGWFNKESN